MSDLSNDETPVTTGGGDDGTSSLLDGARRPKYDLAFAALGAIDEAQVALGGARHAARLGDYEELVKLLDGLQHDMLTAGGIVAYGATAEPTVRLDEPKLMKLTAEVERWRQRVRLEPRFVIAGDTELGLELDRARTTVRRAEREVVALVHERGGSAQIELSKYLNRLSDLMFIMARWADAEPDARH